MINETKIVVEQIKDYPDIRLYRNFLFEGEADYLINKFGKRLYKSGGIGDNGTTIYTGTRTSSSGSIKRCEDEVVYRIQERISKILNTTITKMENLQILNYKYGQEFQFHFDWFFDNHLPYEIAGQR